MDAAYAPIDDADEYLRECTKLEPTLITEEFVRLPADLAYWNERYAKAYRAWLEAKIDTEQVTAVRSMEIRDRQMAIAKGGRVTISEVEQALHVDLGYQRARHKEVIAESEKVRLYGVLDALRTKREMLVSLGAHIRAEMGNDPLIRAQRALDREVYENRK